MRLKTSILLLSILSAPVSADPIATVRRTADNGWREVQRVFRGQRPPGFSVVWYCPATSRGDMPESREVHVSALPNGELRLSPDVFKVSTGVGTALRNLFNGRRSGAALDECLRGFVENFDRSAASYLRSCESTTASPLCQRPESELNHELTRKIRRSSFYQRYRENLTRAEDVLGAPLDPAEEARREAEQAPQPRPPRPRPETERPRPSRPGRASSVVDEIRRLQEQDPARARARALDWMIDNGNDLRQIATYRFQCRDLGNTTSCPSYFTSQQCTNHLNFCRFRYGENNRVFSDTVQILSVLNGRQLTGLEAANALACGPEQGPFNDIQSILSRLEAKGECEPLTAAGDFKVFPALVGDRTMSGNYALHRGEDGAFTASLIMDFTHQGGRFTGAQVRERMNQCFRDYAPFLRSGGEQLNIRILSSQEAQAQLPPGQRPRPMNITLLQGDNGDGTHHRGNTREYNDGFDCPTYLHEVLHDMGLCDEYEENSTTPMRDSLGQQSTMKAAWSCRVIPRLNTVMANHQRAVNDTVPQSIACQCHNDACRNTFRNSQQPTNANYIRILAARDIHSQVHTADLRPFCRVAPYAPASGAMASPDRKYVLQNASASTLRLEERSLSAGVSQFVLMSRVVSCECGNDEVCRRGIAQVTESLQGHQSDDNTMCPPHTTALPEGRRPVAQGSRTSVSGDVIRIVNTPRHQSLLAPNHFQRILFGNCPTGPASHYNRCQRFFQMPSTDPQCQVPNECRDDSYYLGISGSSIR